MALRLSQSFHKRVLLIKKHLEQKKHPLAKIIEFFLNVYSSQHYFLLVKNQRVFLKTCSEDASTEQDKPMIYGSKSSALRNRSHNNIQVLRQEIKGFIGCLVDCVLGFYCITLRPNDIKRDLVENMVANMLIRDEIYTILFRLYSELHDDEIQ